MHIRFLFFLFEHAKESRKDSSIFIHILITVTLNITCKLLNMTFRCRLFFPLSKISVGFLITKVN